MRGFSYTYDQLVLSPRARNRMAKTMERIQKKIDEHIENFRNGTLPRLPGQTLEESFEIYVMHELAVARDESGKIADEDFTLENAGIVMTRTGARGSSLKHWPNGCLRWATISPRQTYLARLCWTSTAALH